MNGVLGHLCAHIGETVPGKPPEDGEINEMTPPSRQRILNSSPGALRPSTLPLGRGGFPQYPRLMTPRSKCHHLRTSCNLPAKVGNVLSCFWSVTLTEQKHLETARRLWRSRLISVRGKGRQYIIWVDWYKKCLTYIHQVTLCDILFPQYLIQCRNISVFLMLGPCPFHMRKKTCRTVTDLGISLSAQWQHGVNIKHWSVTVLHQHTCITFFSKFQHVAYQGYLSLIMMYKTVFSSHHVDVVSMTGAAEKLLQLALVGCGLWNREVKVETYVSVDILQHPHQLFSDAHGFNPSKAYWAKMIKIIAPWYFFTTCVACLATLRNVCHCSWRSPYDVFNEQHIWFWDTFAITSQTFHQHRLIFLQQISKFIDQRMWYRSS